MRTISMGSGGREELDLMLEDFNPGPIFSAMVTEKGEMLLEQNDKKVPRMLIYVGSSLGKSLHG